MPTYVSVEIAGVSPLLVHAFRVEENPNPPSNPGEKGTPREEAMKALYVGQDQKTLIVPGACVFASIIEAGKFHKLGKNKVTTQKSSLVPAGILLPEIELPITPQKWEPDVRPVVIPSTGGRILRYRPRFDKWCLKFTLEVDTTLFSVAFVRTLVDDAGTRAGLCEYRPARRGPFGRFKVVHWTVRRSVRAGTKVKKTKKAG